MNEDDLRLPWAGPQERRARLARLAEQGRGVQPSAGAEARVTAGALWLACKKLGSSSRVYLWRCCCRSVLLLQTLLHAGIPAERGWSTCADMGWLQTQALVKRRTCKGQLSHGKGSSCFRRGRLIWRLPATGSLQPTRRLSTRLPRQWQASLQTSRPRLTRLLSWSASCCPRQTPLQSSQSAVGSNARQHCDEEAR